MPNFAPTKEKEKSKGGEIRMEAKETTQEEEQEMAQREAKAKGSKGVVGVRKARARPGQLPGRKDRSELSRDRRKCSRRKRTGVHRRNEDRCRRGGLRRILNNAF